MRDALLGALALSFAAACTETPQQESFAGRWDVQEIAGASLGEGVDVWIEINSDGAVRGFTGCNAFTAHATAFSTAIVFGAVSEEPGQCASAAAATDEARFLGVLPAIRRGLRRGRALEFLPAESGAEALLLMRLEDPQ